VCYADGPKAKHVRKPEPSIRVLAAASLAPQLAHDFGDLRRN